MPKGHSYGPGYSPYKFSEVLCSDGKRRTAWIVGQPDTYFSIGASVQVKGKTVSGWLFFQDYPTKDVLFHANPDGVNGYLLWREHGPEKERELFSFYVYHATGPIHYSITSTPIGYVAERHEYARRAGDLQTENQYATVHDLAEEAVVQLHAWYMQDMEHKAED